MTFAQFAQSIVATISSAVLPVIFTLSALAFLWGIFKYFILGGADEESQKEGRQFILWGLVGLVVLFSVWGLVRVGLSIIGL